MPTLTLKGAQERVPEENFRSGKFWSGISSLWGGKVWVGKGVHLKKESDLVRYPATLPWEANTSAFVNETAFNCGMLWARDTLAQDCHGKPTWKLDVWGMAL